MHQLTHVALPTTNSEARRKTSLLRRLDACGGYTLGIHTSQTAFHLVNASSVDRIVARADIPILGMFATSSSTSFTSSSDNHGACVVATCARANGTLGIAVIDECGVQLAGTSVDTGSVRHVALVRVSGFEPVVVAVKADGFPVVVGGVGVDRRRRGRPVVSGRRSEGSEREGSESCGADGELDDGLTCGDGAQVDVTVSGDSVIAAYAVSCRVVLRVTTLRYSHSVT